MNLFCVLLHTACFITPLLFLSKIADSEKERPGWMKEKVGEDEWGRPKIGTRLWVVVGLTAFGTTHALHLICHYLTSVAFEPWIASNRQAIINIGVFCSFTLSMTLLKETSARPLRTLGGAIGGFGLGLISIGSIAYLCV